MCLVTLRLVARDRTSTGSCKFEGFEDATSTVSTLRE